MGSECPAQQAPLPPSLRRTATLGIMTALALLSMIAPAVSGVPQGPSSAAASGFRSLLATLSGADAAVPEAKGSQLDTAAERDEAKVETPAVPGLPAPPTPPPPPLVPADMELSIPGGSANRAAEDSDEAATEAEAVAETEAEAEAETAPSPSGSGRGDDQGKIPGIMPMAMDKVIMAGTNEPQQPPRVADARTTNGPAADLPGALGGGAAATDAAEAGARTSAPPTPPPSSPLPVAAPPAPLRPLADRTSRPMGAQTVRIGDGPPASDQASNAPKTATAAPPTTTDPSVRPADFIAAAAAREIAKGGQAGAPAPDMPPLDEGATAQTQAASATRETVVSQLSRVAIETTAQISAQILRRLEGRSTRFEMALTPDDLGRVDVKLDIDAEGRLKARMAFDNPAAATDLRGRADELRRQLEDAGFHLADDALEFAGRDSGSSAFDRGQDSRNGPSRAFADASRLSTEIDVDQPPRWLALSLSPSGVDMKV